MPDDTTKALPGAIRVDEEQLQGHVDEAVRASVEETLNGPLEAEADRLCGRGAVRTSAGPSGQETGRRYRRLACRPASSTIAAAPPPAGPRRQAPRNIASILDAARELGIETHRITAARASQWRAKPGRR